MRKALFATMVVLLLNISLVLAHEHDFNETKQLVDSGISCDKFTDEQLESIGDYYMEQMHPGKAHGIMDNMMGGEGSDSLKQTHIQIAKRLYCNESAGGMMGGGTMNMMMGSNAIGSGGMMGNYPLSYGYSNYDNWIMLWIVFLVAAIILIALLVYKFGIKNAASSETPLGILKKRFARGEITKKQFEAMKRDLEE